MRKPYSPLKSLVMEYGFYILLLLIVVVFTLMSKPFLSVSNWAQMATASTFLLVAAAGLTLVLVIGEIDLSIESIAYMAATVAFLMSDYPLVITIAAALGIGLLTGLFNGWLVAYLGINSLLTTLGLMIAYRGISLVFTEGTVKSSGEALAEIGRIKVASDVPLIFTVALFIVFLFQWVLRSTKLGTYWLAIGNNEDSARKIGVPARRAKLAAYAFCGVSAATSGILLSAYLGEITTFTGRGMEFQAVAAVVIGGTSLFGGRGGVLLGTLAGVFLLVVINNWLGTLGVSPFVYPFVAGGLIFLAIDLDSIKNQARGSTH